MINQRRFYYQEIGKILQLGSPVAVMQLMRMLTTVIVTAMVARLGTTALAASAVGYTTFVVLILFVNGVSMAIGMRIGHHFGANEFDKVNHIAVNGLILALALALPIMLLMRSTHWLFLLCGQKPNIAELAQRYLNALSWAMFPIAIQFVIQQLLLGISKAKALNFFPLISLIFNIPLAYALIFGHWGAAKMGLVGGGYALASSAWLSAMLMVLYILLVPSIRQLYVTSNNWSISWSTIRSLILTGVPIGISIIVEIIYMLIVVFLFGLVSVPAQAAYQVVSQIIFIPMMIPIGISQASTVLLSQHLGRHQYQRLRPSAILAAVMSLLPIVLVSCFFWVAPHALINHFIPPHQPGSATTRTLAIHMLMIIGIVQLLDSVRITIIGSLRGIKDVKSPLYLSLLCFWLFGPPFIALLGLGLKLGPLAMWAGNGVVILLSTVMVVLRFVYRVKHYAKLPSATVGVSD